MNNLYDDIVYMIENEDYGVTEKLRNSYKAQAMVKSNNRLRQKWTRDIQQEIMFSINFILLLYLLCLVISAIFFLFFFSFIKHDHPHHRHRDFHYINHFRYFFAWWQRFPLGLQFPIPLLHILSISAASAERKNTCSPSLTTCNKTRSPG